MKSPLTAKPLRTPGQSVGELLNDRLDNLMIWIVLPAYFIAMALMEWWRYLHPRDPVPWGMTALALVAVLVATVKVRREVQELKRYRQGQNGEIAVGQYLESMRRLGALVIHDIPGNGFNVDHVIICPQGLFVIETKTWSKPDRGRSVITFDCQTLKKNGTLISDEGDEPVTQAAAAAGFIARLVAESTGKPFEAQPVLAFPGWYVEQTSQFTPGEVWALSARALPGFIEKRPARLSDEEVHLAAFHLSRYVRTHKT